MKIISYNISNSKQWKIDRLLEMNADIYVVPEITCPEQAKLPDGYEMAWNGIQWQWQGKDYWKGLGIIWKKGEGIVPEWYNPDLFYAIPLLVDDIIILAFWPTKRKNVTDNKLYPQIAQELIAEYAPHFKDKKVLIIGDYNCYVNQFDYSEKYGDILRIKEILEGYGLKSVYHERTGEDFGKEMKPTYYHMFKEDRPFFIDYAFTNMKPFAYEIGQWDKDMSDHCPQMIVL